MKARSARTPGRSSSLPETPSSRKIWSSSCPLAFCPGLDLGLLALDRVLLHVGRAAHEPDGDGARGRGWVGGGGGWVHGQGTSSAAQAGLPRPGEETLIDTESPGNAVIRLPSALLGPPAEVGRDQELGQSLQGIFRPGRVVRGELHAQAPNELVFLQRAIHAPQCSSTRDGTSAAWTRGKARPRPWPMTRHVPRSRHGVAWLSVGDLVQQALSTGATEINQRQAPSGRPRSLWRAPSAYSNSYAVDASVEEVPWLCWSQTPSLCAGTCGAAFEAVEIPWLCWKRRISERGIGGPFVVLF